MMEQEDGQFDVPILLLVFNRPEHTKRLMAVMRAVRPKVLYIHADGYRQEKAGEDILTQQTRDIVLTGIDWDCDLKCLFRDRNEGLRAGVFDALNWFFSEEAYGIILEDDCIPDPSFFGYCKELLLKYQLDERVMHIGASNLVEVKTQESATDYHWTHFSLVWGWASWRRAWQKMDFTLSGLKEFEGMDAFLESKWAAAYMMDKFEATKARRNNSWAYAWFFSIVFNRGYCILPSVNLVQNVGVGDRQATHTKSRNTSAGRTAGSVQLPLRHPVNKTIEPELEMSLFYATQKPKFRLWLWYLLRQLGRK